MQPNAYVELFHQNHYQFLTGVPDSIFKDLVFEMEEDSRFEHVITNNEGESCALAAGYHLATGKTPIVYMQNSGLGNSINPLTSLLDSEIYSIPALLLISWRGLPGEKDEPQHKRMGNILPGLCNLLDIPFAIANKDTDKMTVILQQATKTINKTQKPFAILIPKGVISSNNGQPKSKTPPENALIREHILDQLVKHAKSSDIFVTTTGKTSRELYEIRERLDQDHSRDFLTVGSMGCASTLALGIAMQQPKRRVILIDGDGACLMRLEALATIGRQQPNNLVHVVIDNNAYESTGAQPTLSNTVDFPAIATACGYPSAKGYDNLNDFMEAFNNHQHQLGMLVVQSYPYSRPNLGRPKTTPIQNKQAFMQQLLTTNNKTVVL